MRWIVYTSPGPALSTGYSTRSATLAFSSQVEDAVSRCIPQAVQSLVTGGFMAKRKSQSFAIAPTEQTRHASRECRLARRCNRVVGVELADCSASSGLRIARSSTVSGSSHSSRARPIRPLPRCSAFDALLGVPCANGRARTPSFIALRRKTRPNGSRFFEWCFSGVSEGDLGKDAVRPSR